MVAFAELNAVEGYRDEAKHKKHGVEESNEAARASDPVVVAGLFHALKNTVQARDEIRFHQHTGIWVFEFVNPAWSYNKDYWKTYKLDWSQITDAQSWKTEIKKDLETDMSKWNDKIWLSNWFKDNDLPGPEIAWKKYSDSEWHGKQPLRWNNDKEPANPEEQQKYIAMKYSGFDWGGILDLDDPVKFEAKLLHLQTTPSEFMQKIEDYCVKGIDGTNPGDFVIKGSHLSESQGVFVVKNGRLVVAMRTDYIEKILFPVKNAGTYPTADIEEKIEQEYTLKPIWEAVPKFKAELDKITPAGTDICTEAENRARVHITMAFQEMIWVRWESARSKIIPRGTVIEKLRSQNLEIKISTGLGHAWGFYYNSWQNTERLSDEGKYKAYAIAEKAAIKAGVDFCRVDIIIGSNNTLIISELTMVPGLDKPMSIPLDTHINKLIAWHRYQASCAGPENAMLTPTSTFPAQS